MRSTKSGVQAVRLAWLLALLRALGRVKKLGIHAILCLIWLLLALLGAPSLAKATIPGEPIQANLVDPPRYSLYPQPICSKCTITAERDDDASGSSGVVLSIAYESEAHAEFEGHIAVTMLISGVSGNTWYTTTILDVALFQGDVATWTLTEPAGNSWQSIELLLVELVPAA